MSTNLKYDFLVQQLKLGKDLLGELLTITNFSEFQKIDLEFHNKLQPLVEAVENDLHYNIPLLLWILSPDLENSNKFDAFDRSLGHFICKIILYKHSDILKKSFSDDSYYKEKKRNYDKWYDKFLTFCKATTTEERHWTIITRHRTILSAELQLTQVSNETYTIYEELIYTIQQSYVKMSSLLSSTDHETDKILAQLISVLIENQNNVVRDNWNRYNSSRSGSFLGLIGDDGYKDTWKNSKKNLDWYVTVHQSLIYKIESNERKRAAAEREAEVSQMLSKYVIPDSVADSPTVRGIKELNSIVGMANIKKFVSSLEAQIVIQNERKKLNLPTVTSQSLHMIFKGNPGTGKTTIARIIGEMLYDIGAIKTNKIIETDRSGLVAQYVGQTAPKTLQIIEEAFGGILFIDEAYTLANDVGGYGQEAIDTLVKSMEDYRDRLIVILAGYSQEMDNFLLTNPGLSSRFANIIEFPDYSLEELMQIAENMFTSNAYSLTEDARQTLSCKLDQGRKLHHFGNARSVRNLFEGTIRNQSTRLQQHATYTKELLVTIESVDIDAT